MRGLTLCIALALSFWQAQAAAFRPPSVPLFARSPFFSVWSAADHLFDTTTSWGPDGSTTEITATVRVDGTPYRVMGAEGGNAVWIVRNNTDTPGNDLPGMPVSLPEGSGPGVCQSLCEKNPDCGGWAFGKPGCGGDATKPPCWLKSSVSMNGIPDTCRDYGIRPSPRGSPVNTTVVQVGLDVLPTRSVYRFLAGPVALNVTFTTAFVPGEAGAAAWSRDSSTVAFSAASSDGKAHDVDVYFDSTGDLITSSLGDELEYGSYAKSEGLAQTMWLKPAHPQTFDAMQKQNRVTFATLALAAPSAWTTGVGAAQEIRSAFVARGVPAGGVSLNASGTSTPGSDNPVLWAAASLRVPAAGPPQPVAGGGVAVAMSFDPTFLFFGRPLRPHWTTLYDSLQGMAEATITEQAAVDRLCQAYDANVSSQLQAAGGEDYRLVGSLAYRQSWASTAPVMDAQSGERWVMLKEISSGSDSQTSDVIYPAFPLYAWADPDAAWRLLIPLMEYANNATDVKYNLAWAPHHLGKYPVGSIGPSQQEQMPIEETAFMLISLAILDAKLGQGSGAWIPSKYNALVDTWGDYLISSTEIPRNQLTTDDFLGPMPNCTNLAAKGIIGLAAYATILRSRGDPARAKSVEATAAQYVEFWRNHSLAPSGDHYQLEYADDGTWSTKYNLMNQVALARATGGDAAFPFPNDVFSTELSFYLDKQFNKYGVPLFSKATFGKADWFSFAGAIMDQAGFNRVNAALRAFLNDSPSRVPFTDWYDTISSRRKGFRCRAVVGGVFSRLFLGE